MASSYQKIIEFRSSSKSKGIVAATSHVRLEATMMNSYWLKNVRLLKTDSAGFGATSIICIVLGAIVIGPRLYNVIILRCVRVIFLSKCKCAGN